jgi:hypothetical protein
MKTGKMERVTVTIPDDLLREIDRLEGNRSRFVAEAVRHELERRRRSELRRSLRNPHPESNEFADRGLADWAQNLPEEDIGQLVDHRAGTAVEWVPGEGWREDTRLGKRRRK